MSGIQEPTLFSFECACGFGGYVHVPDDANLILTIVQCPDCGQTGFGIADLPESELQIAADALQERATKVIEILMGFESVRAAYRRGKGKRKRERTYEETKRDFQELARLGVLSRLAR